MFVACLAALLVVPLAGCGVTRGDDPRDILMIIPNAAGGGYDQTGRAAVKSQACLVQPGVDAAG